MSAIPFRSRSQRLRLYSCLLAAVAIVSTAFIATLTSAAPAQAATSTSATDYAAIAAGQSCSVKYTGVDQLVQCNDPWNPITNGWRANYIGGVGHVGGDCTLTFTAVGDVTIYGGRDNGNQFRQLGGTQKVTMSWYAGSRIQLISGTSRGVAMSSSVTINSVAGCTVPSDILTGGARYLVVNPAAATARQAFACANFFRLDNPVNLYVPCDAGGQWLITGTMGTNFKLTLKAHEGVASWSLYGPSTPIAQLDNATDPSQKWILAGNSGSATFAIHNTFLDQLTGRRVCVSTSGANNSNTYMDLCTANAASQQWMFISL